MNAKQTFRCTECNEISILRTVIPGDIGTGNRHSIYECPACGHIDDLSQSPWPQRNASRDTKGKQGA